MQIIYCKFVRYLMFKYMESKEFVSRLAKKMDREVKDINVLIDGLSQVFKDNLSKLDSIALPGFGEFSAIKEDETISIDRSTGKRLLLPPQISISFKPSTILKKRLSE